jgi:archaemetzincin
LNKPGILLISHGQFEKDILEIIAEDVNKEFNYPIKFKNSRADLNEFYDPTRRQYDGNKIVRSLDTLSEPETLKIIGLFEVDLFIPILTYIFGQAIFKGKTGIVSIYRLKNELYGMKKDEALLLNRLKKVVIHELGHTFGLAHCHLPNCVMRSSTYVEDIDQKKYNLCSSCRKEMEI